MFFFRLRQFLEDRKGTATGFPFSNFISLQVETRVFLKNSGPLVFFIIKDSEALLWSPLDNGAAE
jgi:hypothetical protein